MKDELKEYGLHVEHSQESEKEAIDFEIRDDHDELYVTVWGNHPIDDVQIDCNHDIVEYDDDETVGECVLCGATCDWHKEDNGEGHQERVPHEWYHPKKIGGIVGKYLKELQERW